MKRLVKARIAAILMVLCVAGCGALKFSEWGKTSTTDRVVEAVTPAAESLTVLSGVGGICLLAGMVLLVISRGTMGWRPVIGGVVLVLLNYAVAEYANWIFIPVILATGCISAAWGWKVVENILQHKKEKCNDGDA